MKFNIFTAPLLDRLVDGAVVAHRQQEILTMAAFFSAYENNTHRLTGSIQTRSGQTEQSGRERRVTTASYSTREFIPLLP
jgi:hypothetical protein